MMATWNSDLDTEDADQDSECNYENSGGTSSLPELRILLVGSGVSGKSSAANMILGNKETDLKMNLQSVKRHAEVDARKLVVIEAPGWWQSVDESPAILKQEFVLSLSLCTPGPHAVLVVIDGDIALTDRNKNNLKEFLDILGKPVWNHCIVLFLFADSLGYTTAEQYIESEGKNVRWLVEKCGNRYHVFQKKEKSDEKGDDSQVKDLLEKIDEMLVKNNGCPFEMNSAVLLKLKQNRAEEIERAKVRRMKLQEEKQDHQLHIGSTHHLSEMRMVMVGYINSGRSSTGNTILGKKEFSTFRTTTCVTKHGEVASRKITVIDTPGWRRDLSVDESTELLKRELMLSVSLCPPGPHVILVVVSLKFDFKETDLKVLISHLMLLGEQVWRYALVLFSCGDYLLSKSIEQFIESEGQALQWLVEKCGNRYNVLNNSTWDDGTQVADLLEKVEELVAENDGYYFVPDEKILQAVEENRRAEEERAKQRIMKMQECKQNRKEGIRMRRPEGVSIRDLEESNRPPVQPSYEKSELSLEHDETKTTASFPSYISMKSDRSMGMPPNFSDVSPVHDQSVLMGPQKNYSEECCVCNKVQQDPICLQCGHTYCRQCLETTNFRDGCPKCNDITSTPAGNQTQETSYRPPFPFCHNATFGDIPCDICSDTKLKAVKLCLTCSASYCENHVREHYTVPALQQHLLVEAVGDLRLKRCVTHHRVLEVFCTTDQIDICTLCALFLHKGHDMKVQPEVAGMRMDAKELSGLSYMNTLDKFKILLILFSFLCVLLGVLIYAVI